MLCCCSLAGTVACLNCPNRFQGYYPSWNVPTKKVIEKFDDKGNLIERITEE
jgi:hypothetical protein